jgi:hypothetical protein
MAQTVNLAFIKPGYGESADIAVINDNFQKIDNASAIFAHRTNISLYSDLCAHFGRSNQGEGWAGVARC